MTAGNPRLASSRSAWLAAWREASADLVASLRPVDATESPESLDDERVRAPFGAHGEEGWRSLERRERGPKALVVEHDFEEVAGAAPQSARQACLKLDLQIRTGGRDRRRAR